MKTLASKEKRSAPVARMVRPYIHHPMGPVQQAQQEGIRRILRSTDAQAKFTVGQTNDKYEQEADRVADQVMAMPDPKLQRQPENEEEDDAIQTKPLADQITPFVQRQVETDEEEGEEPEVDYTQNKKADEEDNKIDELTASIMPKPLKSKASNLSPDVYSGIRQTLSQGSALPPKIKSTLEPRFGRNFSKVRIHTGNSAEILCKKLNAKAFATGKNIFFGNGYYYPDTKEGKKLIAHELTHVVQQKGSQVPCAKKSSGKLAKMFIKENTGNNRLQRTLTIGGSSWNQRKARRFVHRKARSYRGRMKRIAKMMVASSLPFAFTNKKLFLMYLKRRVYMIVGMYLVNRRRNRKKCCGYDRGSLTPRVNRRARTYWVKSGTGHYHFDLSIPKGKNYADRAIRFLFVPQRRKRNRTLIDCTHFATVVHYYGMMKSMGARTFRQRVKNNALIVKIRDPSDLKEFSLFAHAKTQATSSGILTEVQPTSKDDYIPGDFVYFRNHLVYSNLQNKVRNPPAGTTCPNRSRSCPGVWMGEHAVYRGKKGGTRMYQGHGIGIRSEKSINNSLWYYLKCHIDWASKCTPPVRTVHDGTNNVVLSNLTKNHIPGLYKTVGGALDTIYRPLVK